MACLAAALLTLTAADSRSSAAALPRTNGPIAFISFRDNQYGEIYVMNPDGSGQTRLTANGDQESDPSWAPDGTRIAFTTTHWFGETYTSEISVMRADGTGTTRLTTGGIAFAPTWSPDGTHIAFSAAHGDTGFDIFVVDADGSDAVAVTDSPADDAMPSWSPDGTRIAFVTGSDAPFGDIHVMNADGTDVVRLTDWGAYGPTWSPDGTKIAFTSARDDHYSDIYVMNADGSDPRRLTTSPTIENHPSWSPDGTRIAFASGVRYGNYDIITMGADGSNLHALTDDPAEDSRPAWGAAPTPPPVVASFSPTSAQTGTVVTIFGTDLGGATEVTFNASATADFTVDSPVQITTTVPDGATTGRITVRTPAGSSTSIDEFTVLPDRISGDDAVATAIAVSQAAFPTRSTATTAASTGASAVVLARSDFFPDALAGGPLAARVHGPLLITPGAPLSDALDPRVRAEVERLLPTGAIVSVLGGPLALSPSIDADLTDMGYRVRRVFGSDQFSTAVAVAEEIGDPSAILEATGLGFPDALSAVPAAIALDGVILLTMDAVQAPETQRFIDAHPGLPRYAVGGPLVASGADPAATPVYGDDLYATSAAVATRWFAAADVYGLATGADFPDALAGGVFMATGDRNGAVLLVPSALPLPEPIVTYLGSLVTGTRRYAFGGPLAISDAVFAACKDAVG